MKFLNHTNITKPNSPYRRSDQMVKTVLKKFFQIDILRSKFTYVVVFVFLIGPFTRSPRKSIKTWLFQLKKIKPFLELFNSFNPVFDRCFCLPPTFPIISLARYSFLFGVYVYLSVCLMVTANEPFFARSLFPLIFCFFRKAKRKVALLIGNTIFENFNRLNDDTNMLQKLGEILRKHQFDVSLIYDHVLIAHVHFMQCGHPLSDKKNDRR